VSEQQITTVAPHAAQYLQLPELRVWGSPSEGSAPEATRRMFVSATGDPGTIAVLAIFGMRPDRPGFSAVGLEGRADHEDAGASEIEIAAAREDGSEPFVRGWPAARPPACIRWRTPASYCCSRAGF